MATIREELLALPAARESLRKLYILYTAHARKQFRYSASIAGHGLRDSLLEHSADEIITVDCDIAAKGLEVLINETFPDETAKVVSVSLGTGFATAEHSRCFDPNIVGNIRRPTETWAQMSRCIFTSHYFVETGALTRWYLDPCMFTSYTTPAEVKSWSLKTVGRPFTEKVKFVSEDSSLVLLALPNAATRVPGFNTGYIQFNRRDFSKSDLVAMAGRAPGVHDPKFHKAGKAALKTINKLLRERAGLAHDWGDYDQNG